MDAGNLLKPALARGELRTIGATTLDEYRKHIEKDAALERRFQPIIVGEPSVEDTIAILRGLKQRYETHHGVRITDSAIVSAAVLSRSLHPGSLPAGQGDRPDRRSRVAAAHRERFDAGRAGRDPPADDAASDRDRSAAQRKRSRPARQQLEKAERELADLQEKNTQLTARWENEKAVDERDQDICRKQLERKQVELEQAQRQGNWEAAARIQYGEMRDLKRKLDEAEEKVREMTNDGNALVKEEVTAEEIAAGRLAAGPAFRSRRMLEGEREKLMHMEERLGQRVIGQDDAVRAVSDAVRRNRAGPGRSESPDRQLPVPRPDRRRQNRAVQSAGRVSVRR